MNFELTTAQEEHVRQVRGLCVAATDLNGYVRKYDVERYFRECRLLKIAPVSQEVVLNSIAEHALGLPGSY